MRYSSIFLLVSLLVSSAFLNAESNLFIDEIAGGKSIESIYADSTSYGNAVELEGFEFSLWVNYFFAPSYKNEVLSFERFSTRHELDYARKTSPKHVRYFSGVAYSDSPLINEKVNNQATVRCLNNQYDLSIYSAPNRVLRVQLSSSKKYLTFFNIEIDEIELMMEESTCSKLLLSTLRNFVI